MNFTSAHQTKAKKSWIEIKSERVAEEAEEERRSCPSFYTYCTDWFTTDTTKMSEAIIDQQENHIDNEYW